MRKKGLAMLLTLAMLLGMLPTTALAAGSEDQIEPQVGQTVEVETVTVDTSDADLPDNDELFAGYVQQLLYPEYGGVSLFGSYGKTALDGLNETIYTALKSEIEGVAQNGGSTKFQLGVDLGINWNTTETGEALKTEASDKFKDAVDTGKILDCLLADCPYDLYWYDKTKSGGAQFGYSISSNGTTASLTDLTVSMAVAESYQGTGENAQYTVNNSIISTAQDVVTTVEGIVTAHANESDYEKLLAYKDKICELTEYNHTAADNTSTPYGDPWQLIYVFDNNPATEVVCEGYSKAFQYLCDKSDFTSAKCYTVTGNMEGGTGAGSHMWNIVKLAGKNYLVDVTNSDAGTVGENGKLFLAGASGSMDSGYTVNNVTYTYDPEIQNLYGANILTLSDTSYQQQTPIEGTVTITGTPKIGEQLTASVTENNTDDTELKYQWYRDDKPIDDATEKTYTPNDAADVGHTIKVVVTAEGYSGTLEDNTDTTVAKGDGPSAPAQPQATATSDTITVTSPSGNYQYACVTGEADLSETDWKDSGEFTGLTANTAYKVYARVAATDTHNASEASPALEITTTAAPINAVTVAVDAPVKNGTPANAAAVSESGITVSKVEWLQGDTPFSENQFAGGTAYTVKITLTANNGQSFASPTSVTLNGKSAGSVSPSGSTLVITKTFPATEAKAVTKIEVTKDPDKTEYVESENFDPTGMVVKATYDDGSENTDFKDYIIEGGNDLKKGTTSVTIKAGDATTTVSITVKGVLTASDFTYAPPTDLTYNGTAKAATVTENAGITGAVTVWYEGTNGTNYTKSQAAPTNAGTYKVTFDVAASTDYAAATGLTAGEFTIQKATSTIQVNSNLTVTLNKQASLNATTTPSGLQLSYESKDSNTATVDDSGMVTGKAVGKTTITVSCTGNENYNAAEKTVNVTVTDKQPVNVTFTALNASQKYTEAGYKLGEQFNEATVADSKIITGYKYDGETYQTLTDLPMVTAVGTYTVTAFYSDDTYYGEQAATFTITKADQAALTISSANTVTFGETLKLTTNGGSGNGAVTYIVTNGTGSATVNGDVLAPTKAGTVTVTATKAADSNYNEVTSAQFTITINKAQATEAMKTASGTIVAGTAGSVTLPTLPAGATYGTVSLGASTTNDNVVNPSVSGGKLTYTGGNTVAVGTAYTVTIAVNGGDNYDGYTITVTLTGSNKITPTLTVNPINVIYTGKDVPTSAITGTAKDGDKTVSGKWNWGTGKPVPKNVADSGSYQVFFTPDDEAYASGTATVQVTISKATPTGAPKYTTISTSGKTLANAGLTTTGSTFSVPGQVAWAQATTTEVVANTAYKWIFTPTDTANYNTLTGSITLWQRSSSGSDSTSGSSGTVSQPSTSGGTSTVTTDVNSSTSGSTASASVSTSTMNTAVDRALNAAEKNGTDPVVAISVDVSSRADSVKVTLPASSLKTLGKNADASLTVVSDVAEVTLDSDAISAVALQAGSTVTLQVAPVATSALNSRQEQAVGNAPVFDLSFKSGSTTISDFDGGRVTVTLPYTLKSGQTANGIVVWYMDNNGNLTACNTTYSTSRREVTFTTTHFSKYVIGYEAQEPVWINRYSDVYRGAWYYDAVKFVTDKGLMNGTATARFSPDETTTRAMIVTILWRQSGNPSSSSGTRFSDVDPSQWYGSAVRWAAANNIVTGYGDGMFGPEDAITREQMAAILYRYAQYKGYPVGTTGSLSGYTDANSISNYAVAAFRWICGRGIMEGTSFTTLGPAESATRAQVATILMRFCNEYNL